MESGGLSLMLQGKEVCDTNHQHSNPFNDGCTPIDDPIVLLFVIPLSIALALSLLVLRLVYVRYCLTPKGQKRIADNRRFWHGSIGLSKKNDELVWYKPKTERLRLQNEAKRNEIYAKEVRQYKLHPSLLLKAMILGATVLFSCPIEVNSTDQPITSSTGQTLFLKEGLIHLTDAYQIHPLIFSFTGDFSSVLEQNWWCSSSACNSPSQCDDMGQLGVWESHKLSQCTGGKKALCLKRNFCQLGTTGCFAAMGCLKWSVTYEVNPYNLWRIFKIGQGTDHLFLDTAGFLEDPIIDVRLDNHFDASNYVVAMTSDNLTYLCQMNDNNLCPAPSKLGDLQVNFNLSGIISWEQTKCRAQAVVGVSCDTISSFSHLIRDACHLLPVQVGEYSLEYKLGSVMVRRGDNVKVSIDHKLHMKTMQVGGHCEIIESSVSGVIGGDLPYYLTLKTNIVDSNQHVKFDNICTGQTYMVPCDGGLHMFSVPPLMMCPGSPNVDKISESERGFIDTGDKIHLKNMQP